MVRKNVSWEELGDQNRFIWITYSFRPGQSGIKVSKGVEDGQIKVTAVWAFSKSISVKTNKRTDPI